MAARRTTPRTADKKVKTASKQRAPVRARPEPSPEVKPEERLRRAAFQCFSEGGFHETKVDDICKKAGVSKGAFYWYFESKEQVFVQILEVWAKEVEGEIIKQFQDALEDDEPQKALLIALGREGRRGRRLLPVWLDALVQSQRHPELKAAMRTFLQRMRRTLARVLEPTFAPFYGTKERETLASLILSSFLGSIAQQMAEPEDDLYDEHSRMLLVTVEHFGRLLQNERTLREAR